MSEFQNRVDSVRPRLSEREVHLVDEFLARRLSRRDFVRLGTVMGIGLPTLSFLAAGCTSSGSASGPGAISALKKGGKMVVAILPPAHEMVDPLTVVDAGGAVMIATTGEYLIRIDKDFNLVPALAEKWSANADATVWTFRIRQGVKFHDGTPMTARDVAATLNRLSDPANKSNALSAFTGIFSKDAARVVDDATVECHLDVPYGNFPYLVSWDNYNAIIIPATFSGDYHKSFVGTGPWKLSSYRPKESIAYIRNPDYWDRASLPILDSFEFHFVADEKEGVARLQAGTVDAVSELSAVGAQVLFSDPRYSLLSNPTSAHRQVYMNTGQEPFTDKRVRQALALLLDRPNMLRGLINGQGEVGNDTPFAPAFPSTDKTVAQRSQDVAKAKSLLAEAGKGDGFKVTLTSWRGYELPQLAEVIQAAAKQVGITIDLNILETSAAYYGDAVFGKSPWLDSVLGIVDYINRGIPNVYLAAPLLSTGTWNASHFKNPQYDQLVKTYVAAADLQVQKKVAGDIQRLLLEETPLIIPYFRYHLAATKAQVAGLSVSASGFVDMRTAGFKA